ncbi:adenosine receptor A2b-like [Trichomycterus rosablanca]|uniref:adenosine receptor A2b-like n=1 Tax=Trichomycterus rosablanca TaxID=2290929 RepID=UPI002F359D3F
MVTTMNSCLVVNQNDTTQPIIAPSMKFLLVPYIAVEVIISILSMSGNLLVCVAVGCNKKLQTVTNYFLVSLAVADLFVGALAIPFAIITDLGLPHHNLYLCIAIVYMLIMFTQSSIFSLLAVAVERYVAILLPFHYHILLKPRNGKLVILLIWVLSCVLSSVPLQGWQIWWGRTDQIGYCFFFCVVDISYLVYFSFFACMVIPLLAMFIIYIHIFITVRGHVRRITAVSAALEVQTGQDAGMRKEAKKASSIFLLVFVFAFCWMPIHVINCVQLFCPHYTVPVSLILSAIILSHMNSAINPLLYAYRMKSFRLAFKTIFLCCRVSPPLSDTTDTKGT